MGFDRSPSEEARRSADAVGLQRIDDGDDEADPLGKHPDAWLVG